MGIVVAVCMWLILLLSVPNPLRGKLEKRQGMLALLSFLAGVWNFAFYGSFHLGEFWGNAAFISGFFMMFSSFPLLQADTWPAALKSPIQTLQRYRQAVHNVINHLALFALAIYAALYTYALVLLNLGAS
ncbi:hypothetical protein [Marinomonas flavescens]|uniref:hypothetical protein n=1 Tax=Marinomonas flavescens TaxID=2529379 RepID=UPI0010559576|nr:hypothetical protein [Marinomonas flavescens]